MVSSATTRLLPAIQAPVKFLRDTSLYDSEKPYYFSGVLDRTQESSRTNLEFEEHLVTFNDLRGHEELFNVDTNGVEFVRQKLDLDVGTINDDEIRLYLNTTTAGLKDKFRAEFCFCYSYKVCTRTALEN
jgi:hypothetical protein